MKVYRYEHSDGGGPFCTFNGLVRGSPDNLIVDNDCLYGCESINKLNEYFDYQKNMIKNCKIFVYNIPKEDVYIGKYQVIFPKKYYKNKKEYKGQ